MSYINETLTNLQDFVTKLDAFLTGTPGWTQDQLNTGSGQAAWHKSGADDDVYVSVRWDTSSPNFLGLYHALGYTGGNVPGNHPDDSGNGAVSGTDATIGGQRRQPITNTPVQYWAFEDDDYCHVVIETSVGVYTHMGFGVLDKIGDWTGGAYAYAWRHTTGVNTGVAVLTGTSVLLDGLLKDTTSPSLTNAEEHAATIHCEGLANQSGSGKWAVHMGNQSSANLGTDRAAVARLHFVGGFRAGPIAFPLGRFAATSQKALTPMYALGTFHWDRSTGDVYGPLGYMKDVRGISIKNYAPGDEIVVGGDTWVVFPSRAKYSSSLTNTSAYQGIAYRKVTT